MEKAMSYFSRSGRSSRSRRRSVDSDDDKENAQLRRLREEYQALKDELAEGEEDFRRMKESTGSKKSRIMIRLEDAREKLNELQDEYDQDQEEYLLKKKVLEGNKRKNSEMLSGLEENTRDFKAQYNEKAEELDNLIENNRKMKEDLAEQRQDLEREQQKLDALNREIESVRIRDQSVFFSFEQNATRRRNYEENERSKLLDIVAENCKEVRELVIKRYQLRESVRGKQNEIIEAKQKIQEVKRKIESVRDHEDKIIRMSEYILKGLENSTAEYLHLGTSSRHRNRQKETKTHFLRKSNDHIELITRNVPEDFQSLELQATQGSSSVNPKYRSLLTSLLQKIGLLMMQYNHHQLHLAGEPVLDYKDQLNQLHTKNLWLRKELEALHEDRGYKLSNMKEEIPRLEGERDRLRESRDDIVDKFEQYKKKRVDLEDLIRKQKREIKEKEKVYQEHDELREQVRDLREQLNEKMHKMKRGDRSVNELHSLVHCDMKRHGLAPLENPDDEDETDPDESG